MLKELSNFIFHFSWLNIFKYVTFRAPLGALTGLLFSLIVAPPLIGFLQKKKASQMIRQDGPQSHLATKVGTPTMGGILIVGGVLLSVLFWMDLRNIYSWLVIAAILGFGLIGFLDDYLKIFRKNSDGLKPWFKLCGQIVVSFVLVLVLFLYRRAESLEALANGLECVHPGDLFFPFIKDPICNLGWFYIPLGVFWIVGFSNAVNLTDGLDGLAAGLMIFVSAAFAILCYLAGHIKFANYLQIPCIAGAEELTVAALSLMGATAGFLWYNAHPAKIFMGDTGSLMLGGLVGLFSLIVKKEILLLLIGGVFVLETVSVIIQVISFKLTKKRVFKMSPIHHHFELSGWTETQVVIRFWLIGGMLVLLALLTLKIQ